MLKASAPKVLGLFPFTAEFTAEAEKFKKAILGAKTILISSTLTSDGDSIGAQLGLWNLIVGLRGANDGIVIVNHSPVPKRYKFLQGTERIQTMSEFTSKTNGSSFDVGITCDGGVERTGDVAPLFESAKSTVLVDHHAIGSERSYTSKLLNMDASSTCELVYMLHEYFGVEVDKAIAESLYVGIVFDTGFFKHSLTKPMTHLVAARLIATGIDFSKISDRAILERSWAGQLLLKAMLDNMERSSNGQVILSFWSEDEMSRIGAQDGDQEGLINQLYHTDTVEVVGLLTEKSVNDVKVSFRSKGRVNVAELARSLDPQGGGHIRASGCTLRMNLSDARKHVMSEILKVL